MLKPVVWFLLHIVAIVGLVGVALAIVLIIVLGVKYFFDCWKEQKKDG